MKGKFCVIEVRSKRQATLSHEKLLTMLQYDPAIGIFFWRVYRNHNAKAGDVAGTLTNNGYIVINFDDRPWMAHRLAWFYVTGEFPIDDIDHINRTRNDNRFSNLRVAHRSLNGANKMANPEKTIRAKGVFLRERGRFRAIIQFGRCRENLGSYGTIDEAAHAYNKAAVRLFGDFAVLNPVGEDYV